VEAAVGAVPGDLVSNCVSKSGLEVRCHRGSISPELQSALNQLATAVTNLEAAYKTGDVAKIGEAQTAVNQAAAAVARARSGG